MSTIPPILLPGSMPRARVFLNPSTEFQKVFQNPSIESQRVFQNRSTEFKRVFLNQSIESQICVLKHSSKFHSTGCYQATELRVPEDSKISKKGVPKPKNKEFQWVI